MNRTKNARLSGNARALRRNMTKEERHLWYDFLKGLPIMIHRQKVIGPYIVDFYAASVKTVIEIDGSQHYTEQGRLSDEKRDAYLKELGMKILRYSNADVNQRFRAVCQDIWEHIIGSPQPSP